MEHDPTSRAARPARSRRGAALDEAFAGVVVSLALGAAALAALGAVCAVTLFGAESLILVGGLLALVGGLGGLVAGAWSRQAGSPGAGSDDEP
jgi:hypothetical protein